MVSQSITEQFADPSEKQQAQALLQFLDANKIPDLNQTAMFQTLQAVIAAHFLPNPLPDAQSDLGAAIKSSLLLQYENDKREINNQNEISAEKQIISENNTQNAENIALRDAALAEIADQLNQLSSQPMMANLLADFDLTTAQTQFPQITETFKDSPDKQMLILKASYLLQQLQTQQEQPEVADFMAQNRESIHSLSQSYNQLAQAYTLPKIELKKPDALARETARKLSNSASATDLLQQPAAMVAALQQNYPYPHTK